MHGDDWEAKIDESPQMKKHVCITTVWKKVVENTAKAFRGTKHENDFMIYHDALVLLTAKTTVEWLKKQMHGAARTGTSGFIQ